MQQSDFLETTAEAVAAKRPEFDHFAMERAIPFSDAVYAIIITLLALDSKRGSGNALQLSVTALRLLPGNAYPSSLDRHQATARARP